MENCILLSQWYILPCEQNYQSTDNCVFRHHHTLHDVVPLSKQLMLFYYHPIKHGSDQTKNLGV